MHNAILAITVLGASTANAAGPVEIGQHQRVGRFVVTPVRIDEDSRCPMNARCVWAGRLTVSAVVRDGRRRVIRHFTLGEPSWPGIVLDRVMPDRVAGGPRRPLRYRFHFSPGRVGV